MLVGELFQTGEAVGCPGAGRWHKSCQKGFLGLFPVTTPCTTVPRKQGLVAIAQLKVLHRGMRWGIKHPAQEICGLLPFNSTEQDPCLSFSLSHFPLSHRSRMCWWAGLIQSWHFKEERSHSMNYLWICCRELVSFTPFRGAKSSTELLSAWILQDLIGAVFSTTAFVGGDVFPSSIVCVLLWNVKFLEPSGCSLHWPKGVEQGIHTRCGSMNPVFVWNEAEAWLQACAPEELLPCQSGTRQRYVPQPCPTLR